MSEDLDFLTEEEFKELHENEKWDLIQNLKKVLQELRIRAEKNCEECEKTFLTAEDINIDLFFQDWRACAENCEECGDEEKTNMCQIQFELMNHIANTLLEIQRKQNILTQIVLKRDETGSALLKDFMKKKEEYDKKSKESNDIFQ